jgi:DNA mismatch repair protein MutL
MPEIHQLPPSVVNKIAAGEVIERAASVVKELMENALDAGATRIDVSVEGGGSELVRVVDNGCGMRPDQFPLAIASHATSKIRTADDLFRVATLGFRGEALASIASVSRLTLRSRPPEAEAGAELEVLAGEPSQIVPCGCPAGTSIEVRQLFFNTPVRRKFLKSPQTELGHVSEAFTRLALAHPGKHFALRHNGRTLYDLPPTDRWMERIGRFFGQELAENLIWVEGHDDRVRLSGYVAHPSQSRSHPRMQYLFLNGRFIRDRALQHALGEAYRGLLLTGRYPISFLWFDMPAELVDVNVHPTKLEVRFQDGGRLYSQLLGTLRTRFLSTNLTTRLEARDPAPAADGAMAHDPRRADELRQELVDWAKGQVASWGADALSSAPTGGPVATQPVDADDPFGPAQQTRFDLPMPAPRKPLELNRIDNPWPVANRATPSPLLHESAAQQGQAVGTPSPLPNGFSGAAAFSNRSPSALQVHNRYLIAETDEGMVVIDQHALHERILYEQLRERVLAGVLESQALLVPEPVDLSAAEVAAVLDQRQLLAQLGVAVEPFGGDTLLVRSYPAMLANIRPVEILRALLDQLLAGGKAPDRRDVLDELLHMISCKAAIKAGDRLTPDEMEALLEQRHLVADTHHCPHGRPTALVFTREDLDRQFKRT